MLECLSVQNLVQVEQAGVSLWLSCVFTKIYDVAFNDVQRPQIRLPEFQLSLNSRTQPLLQSHCKPKKENGSNSSTELSIHQCPVHTACHRCVSKRRQPQSHRTGAAGVFVCENLFAYSHMYAQLNKLEPINRSLWLLSQLELLQQKLEAYHCSGEFMEDATRLQSV